MSKELNIQDVFSKFVRFNARNKITLLSFIVISVLFVVLFQKFKTPYYETKAICMSGISDYERQEQIENLSQRTAIDLVNHLQINIENKDIKQLAKKLGVKESIASSIKKIEAEQLYQQDMEEKYYALNKFEVSLTVYDNTKIQNIQNGLIYYFQNNQYVKNYHSKYIQSNKKIINDIENELSLLNDVRREGAKNNLDVSSVNIISGKDGKEISNQIVNLSQLREEIKMKQDLLNPLVYVQEFANVDKKEDDILLWGMIAIIIGYILGLFFVLIKRNLD
mgnify:FL=1|tara:strand:- start:584 stop:1420 length:837 start_codon:yes stop_codon:yes gene_type:complete